MHFYHAAESISYENSPVRFFSAAHKQRLLPTPRTSEIGPAPRPVISIIQNIICRGPIMSIIGNSDAIGAAR